MRQLWDIVRNERGEVGVRQNNHYKPKKYNINKLEDLKKLFDDIEGEDPVSIGLRAITKKQINKRRLSNSILSRDDESQSEWRELDGASVILAVGDWFTEQDARKIKGLTNAYREVLQYDTGNGIAIVKGSPNIDEVFNDPY